tara:strand:- start:218 stop:988 length:771 start_codon:yes stop_codon:yes gene_type:complete
MAEQNQNNFLVKVDKIRKKSYASMMLLKQDDVIVAVNNQFYTFGEKKLTEELKDLKKNNEKAILTILREEVFFDIIVNNSLGCKFLTTNFEETENIKKNFSKKENNDVEELNEYVAMRDIFRRYDVFDNSNSLSAGLFPPAWLAYNRKWWVLLLFVLMSFMLLSINIFMFLLGWVLTSVYCYQAQLNLLYSFSMLEGKVFTLKLASKSMEEAQKTIRSLDPKSKFLFSKLENPKIEEDKENEKNQNIVDEKKEALV